MNASEVVSRGPNDGKDERMVEQAEIRENRNSGSYDITDRPSNERTEIAEMRKERKK